MNSLRPPTSVETYQQRWDDEQAILDKGFLRGTAVRDHLGRYSDRVPNWEHETPTPEYPRPFRVLYQASLNKSDWLGFFSKVIQTCPRLPSRFQLFSWCSVEIQHNNQYFDCQQQSASADPKKRTELSGCHPKKNHIGSRRNYLSEIIALDKCRHYYIWSSERICFTFIVGFSVTGMDDEHFLFNRETCRLDTNIYSLFTLTVIDREPHCTNRIEHFLSAFVED